LDHSKQDKAAPASFDRKEIDVTAQEQEEIESVSCERKPPPSTYTGRCLNG